jgi:hypothetical protein
LKTQSKDPENIDKPVVLSKKKYSDELLDLQHATKTWLQNAKALNNATLMKNHIIPHLLRQFFCS